MIIFWLDTTGSKIINDIIFWLDTIGSKISKYKCWASYQLVVGYVRPINKLTSLKNVVILFQLSISIIGYLFS